MQAMKPEKSGPLPGRRRTLSRSTSEEESLRSIMREAEESSRTLSRSDSWYGSLKRGARTESLNEEDLLPENIDVELRTLALQQEALLFQRDCLQDALEGAEEALAEAQSSTHRIQTELESERERSRRLQEEVCSLKEQLARFREERRAEQLQWRRDGPAWLHVTPEGTSVDREERPLELHLSSPQQQKHEDAVGDDNEESSGYEDAPSEFSPAASTPDDGDPMETDAQLKSGSPGPNPGDSCTLS